MKHLVVLTCLLSVAFAEEYLLYKIYDGWNCTGIKQFAFTTVGYCNEGEALYCGRSGRTVIDNYYEYDDCTTVPMKSTEYELDNCNRNIKYTECGVSYKDALASMSGIWAINYENSDCSGNITQAYNYKNGECLAVGRIFFYKPVYSNGNITSFVCVDDQCTICSASSTIPVGECSSGNGTKYFYTPPDKTSPVFDQTNSNGKMMIQ